jgi:hypothetical protein
MMMMMMVIMIIIIIIIIIIIVTAIYRQAAIFSAKFDVAIPTQTHFPLFLLLLTSSASLRKF